GAQAAVARPYPRRYVSVFVLWLPAGGAFGNEIEEVPDAAEIPPPPPPPPPFPPAPSVSSPSPRTPLPPTSSFPAHPPPPPRPHRGPQPHAPVRQPCSRARCPGGGWAPGDWGREAREAARCVRAAPPLPRSPIEGRICKPPRNPSTTAPVFRAETVVLAISVE